METHKNAGVSNILNMYRTMVRIRVFEEATEVCRKDGDVVGSAHLSIGQEAVAAGVCGNLKKTDLITSTHRGHGHTIAKGCDLTAMMCELFGRAGGTSEGKGGSMHIADFSIGMLGANGVVAAGIPIAIGAAQGLKLRGSDNLVACFFGDGAINRGPFFEGLNWAKIYDLPVLFVCEDNSYAAYTRTSAVTAGKGAAARAEGIGVPAFSVDGNDLIKVNQLAHELVEKIRNGEGPQFLHAQTYRIKGHTVSDAGSYRSTKEVEEAFKRDPITRCGTYLVSSHIPQTDLDQIWDEARKEIDKTVGIAKMAPWPEHQIAYADVQNIGAQEWES